MGHRRLGFTLYELLITLLLVGILAGAASPTFSALLARQKQRVELNALFSATHLARKESILKRRVATLCPTKDFNSCAGTRDWSTGWILFENRDRDSPAFVDPDEPILKRHQVADNIKITANRKAFTQRATFLRATNGTLVVCDQRHRVPPKALVISFTGRPRVADHTTRGELYSCAD